MLGLPFQFDPDGDQVQAPPIVRYTTMVSAEFNDPAKIQAATNLLIASAAGAIFQFYNAQQQMGRIGGLPQASASFRYPAVDVYYTRNQNTSQVNVTLYPEAVSNLDEALEYAAKRANQNLPLSLTYGKAIKIDLPFTDWGIGTMPPHPPTGWATGAGVRPYKVWAASEAVADRQYFELELKQLPRGTHPPDQIWPLGGTDGGSYTDSPIKHHTDVQDTFKWPSGLDTFGTPSVGLISKTGLLASTTLPVRNPFTCAPVGFAPGSLGAVALSMIIGKEHTHSVTTTSVGGYYDGDGVTLLAPNNPVYDVGSPVATRTWHNGDMVSDGNVIYHCDSVSGSADNTGPPPGSWTSSSAPTVMWSGLQFSVIGTVSDGYIDTATSTIGGWVYTFAGTIIHIPYSSSSSATDTDSDRHKYGDVFSGVPGATAFDDGSTDSEIPPNHGEGHTFPVLYEGNWYTGGVALDPARQGDIIMVAVDATHPVGKVWFGKNGRWSGRPGLDGEAATFDARGDKWYPAAGGFGNFHAVLHLGLGLKYPLPSGFKPAGGDSISFDIPIDLG